MDDSQRVIQWILEHAHQIQLSVKAYNWSEVINTDCGIKDCQASIIFNNKKYIGRGTALNEDDSFLKAIGEAFDRYLFDLSDQLTTNGFAIHSTPTNAKVNAISELIERDRFFCHFLTETPFYESKIKINDLPINNNIFQFLEKNNINYGMFEMRKLNNYSSFIFFAEGLKHNPSFGFSFGLGCNLDPKKAACSSIIEGLVNLLFRIDNSNYNSLSLTEFLNQANEYLNGNPNKIDILKNHEKLAFNLDYFLKIKHLFQNARPESENVPEVFDENLIKVNHLSWPEELKTIPLFGCHAESDHLQNIYFGPTTENNLNFQQLSRFIGKTITWQQIQKLPHPLD